MEESPPTKKPRDGEEEAENGSQSGKPLCILAKKTVKGATHEFEINDMPSSSSIGMLRSRIAKGEECEPSQVTLICKGKMLNEDSPELSSLADKAGADGKILIVYLLKKPAGATTAVAPTPVPKAAVAPSSEPTAQKDVPESIGQEASRTAAVTTGTERVAESGVASRVILLLRHGQCCHDGEGSPDEMKALTVHGQRQADASARFISQLFAADVLPSTRALLHSTSRRARETAARIPVHVQGIDVWNADLLRETDPTKNPFRAEEVFQRIFVAPPAGASDTLIIVAHNNIILYLLMRAADVPIERAAQAWRLFHLQHASVTRIDLLSSGLKQIVAVGGAGHIPKDNVTWSNISGPDLVEWSGGGPERHKLSGRTILLVRQVAPDDRTGSRQMAALATHVKGLGEYMISGHMTITCTTSAEPTAVAIAQKYRLVPQVLPDSITEEPEAAFLQFFCPPTEHKRDTVVIVAEDGPVIYWLLRSLYMTSVEAKASASFYRVGHASISIIQIKSDGSMRAVGVGDTCYLPLNIA